MKECPQCAEQNQDQASFCWHCGAAMPPQKKEPAPEPAIKKNSQQKESEDLLKTVVPIILFGFSAALIYFFMEAPFFIAPISLGLISLGGYIYYDHKFRGGKKTGYLIKKRGFLDTETSQSTMAIAIALVFGIFFIKFMLGTNPSEYSGNEIYKSVHRSPKIPMRNDKCITLDGYPAALTEELFDKAVRLIMQKDNIAFQKLLDSKLVISLKPGVSVFIEETGFSVIKIRPEGENISVYTNREAVNCS